jgi:hypothetical protein
MFDATDTSGAESASVHDEGVELDLAVAVQKTAAARVKGFIVFENDHGFFNRIESRATALQRAPSGSSGVAHTVKMRLDHVVGNGPGTTVNDQNRICWHSQTPQLRGLV